MNSSAVGISGVLFFVIYGLTMLVALLSMIFFVVVAWRFMRAHERIAEALGQDPGALQPPARTS